MDEQDRLHIRGVIVGMRQAAMDQHDYGLFMSPSRIRADAFRDVLIATGLADDEMVQEHEDDIEAVREQLARTSAEVDSLRERIRQEVYEAYQAGIDHNQVPFKYPAMGKSEVQEATERIIAAFEAVLLSDEVVEAAARALHERHWIDGWDSESEDNKRYYLEDAKAALQAAAKGTEGSA